MHAHNNYATSKNIFSCYNMVKYYTINETIGKTIGKLRKLLRTSVLLHNPGYGTGIASACGLYTQYVIVICSRCIYLLLQKDTIHTCNMGRHQTRICNVCFKTIQSDKLKSHKKKHEGENEDNIVTKGVHDVKTAINVVTNREQKSWTDEELEKRVITINKEFNRNIELGHELNKIMNKK